MKIIIILSMTSEWQTLNVTFLENIKGTPYKTSKIHWNLSFRIFLLSKNNW